MADRPILFSAPMVRALLDVRKTQTRRILKPVGSLGNGWPMYPQFINGKRTGDTSRPEFCDLSAENGGVPLYAGNTSICPGDQLWVKETWRTESRAYDDLAPSEMGGEETILYDADADWNDNKTTGKTRVSIHMPRWASRTTLIVTDVRVERLQDISEGDAVAEGIEPFTDFQREGHWKRYRDGGWNSYVDSPIASYASLWTEINGPGSWEANPWVAAYTFTVIKQNIDQIEKVAA